MSKKGTSGHDESLLTTMAARLRKVEEELQKRRELCERQEHQLHKYRVRLGELENQEDLIRHLRSECFKAHKQIQEMEEFLADYGMIWVGDNPDDGTPDGDGAPGRRAQGGKQGHDRRESEDNRDVWVPPNSIANFKPDYNLVIANVSDLNIICGEGVGKIKKGADGISRVHHEDPIPLALYANGIFMRSGPFRSFSDKATRRFIVDLQDGYFPSELQELYPNGHPLKVVDLREKEYVDARIPVMFPGEGHTISESQREAADIRGLDISNDLVDGKSHNPVLSPNPHDGGKPPESLERFLKKLPANVVRDGKIIDIRSTVGKIMGSEAPGSPSIEVVKTEVVKSIQSGANWSGPVATLRVKLDHGSKTLIVKLPYHSTISDLRKFIDQHKATGTKVYEIRTTFPNKKYDQVHQTLEEAGLVPSANLHVRDM